MTRSSSMWGRALAVLAVVALGVMTVAPAFSAHNNKHVRKIARKVVKNQGGKQFINDGQELDRLGLVTLQQGVQPVRLGTYGPFALWGSCADSGGNVRGTIEIVTSQANSIFSSVEHGAESDFDPSDSNAPILVDAITGNAPGGAASTSGDPGQFRAAAPDGTTINGLASVSTNFAGAHCAFSGFVVRG